MNYQGWIKLYRQILDCDIWISDDESFDKRSAWIDLLLLANHRDKQTIFDGQPFTVERGQYLTSVRKLSTRWGWGNKKTLNYLRLLESLGMIKKDSDSRRTLITIEKYEVYQGVGNTEETLTTTVEDTVGERKPPTNKNIKNDKNEKNKDKYMCAFEDFWKEYPRKVDKGNCYKQYQARLKSGFTEEELLTACKNYANECKKNRTEAKYIKHGATFLSATTPFVDYLKGDTNGAGVSRLPNGNEISDEESRAIYNNDECPFDMP